MTTRHDLAFDLALRALDEQRLTLDSLRTRASLVMAIAAVVNVELGRIALTGGAVSQPMFAAGGADMAALAVLPPRASVFSAPHRPLPLSN